MALHYRKRGDVWNCRGSVRIGRNTFPVREFSTGCTTKIEAQAVGAAEEARIRAEFLDTGDVIEPVRVITIHDCIVAYRSRPGRLHRFDVQRLEEFDATIGNHHLSRAPEAWSAWLRTRGRGLAPSTVARWRSTLLAALTYGAEEYGVAVRSIRSVRGVDAERIAYLTPQQEARLLASYQPVDKMPVVPCEATSNRAWAPRRTKESHLRPVGFFCCSKGASIDFVNGLLSRGRSIE